MLSTARRAMLAVGVCIFTATRIAAGGTIPWITDYEEAKQRAQAEHKLLLVNIHAEWCVPCKQLQAGTLSDPGLADEIAQTCVPLSLDLDLQGDVVNQWQVTAYPTQLFLSPDGRVVHSLVGNVSVGTYRTALSRALEAAGMSPLGKSPNSPATKDRPALPSAPYELTDDAMAPSTLDESEDADGPVVAQPSNAELPPAIGSATTDKDVRPRDMSKPLALNGFCPVHMIQNAELSPGDPAHCCVYKDKRYQFYSSEDMARFVANPKKYLPTEEGFCVVTWAEDHKRSAGSIEYPALFGDYLYLFAGDDARQKFLHDPERYVDAQGRAHRIPLQSFRGDRKSLR